MIYYITQGSEYIKIGYTTNNPEKRLIGLQTGNPIELKLALVTVGDKRHEYKLHSMFNDHHVRGEWFYLSKQIQQYMDERYTMDVRYMIDPAIIAIHSKVMALRDG